MNIENPRVVIIGGGHGPSAFRKGLKERTTNLTSLVPFSDSGGSAGLMAKEYDARLVGDQSQAWADQAVSETQAQILRHRYSNGSLHPHRTGNVLFQSAVDVCRENGSTRPEIDALNLMKGLIPIVGDVFPMSLDRRELISHLADGTKIMQEHLMDERQEGSPIVEISLSGKAMILPEAAEKIEEATLTLVGPGSVYGSICCTMLPEGVSQAIQNSKGLFVFAVNIANVKGQTNGWDINKHIETVEEHAQRSFDAILYFTRELTSMSGKIRDVYSKAGQGIVTLDGIKPENRERLYTYDLVRIDYVEESGVVKPVFRHDQEESANSIFDLLEKFGVKNKPKIYLTS